MSEVDVVAQNALNCWLSPFILIFLSYSLLKKHGPSIRDRFVAVIWTKANCEYHEAVRRFKTEHFSSMKYHKSFDKELRNKGLVRVLEIGAGIGANFEFFPLNCHLTVVEPNAFFEPIFYETREKFPAIKLDRFVVGCAEDMEGVADGSIDIVVSTLVLCSVRSLEKTFKEVQRILAPGGKFYYWEHIHDAPGTWLHLIQDKLTLVWHFFLVCRLNRKIDQVIASDKGFSDVKQKVFDIPFQKGFWKLVKVHVMGVATK